MNHVDIARDKKNQKPSNITLKIASYYSTVS